jgi:hypothetical protein
LLPLGAKTKSNAVEVDRQLHAQCCVVLRMVPIIAVSIAKPSQILNLCYGDIPGADSR